MMNLNKYVENHGTRIIFAFVLIDLEREIKVGIVFKMRAKRLVLIVLLKQNLFKKQKCCIQLKTEKIWKI